MKKLIKIISIISISLVSVFSLTGCPIETPDNVTENNMTINLEEGDKFVDIKVIIYRNTYGVTDPYVYTLTKKREASEKPETYKLDMVFQGGHSQKLHKHITIIEN